MIRIDSSVLTQDILMFDIRPPLFLFLFYFRTNDFENNRSQCFLVERRTRKNILRHVRDQSGSHARRYYRKCALLQKRSRGKRSVEGQFKTLARFGRRINRDSLSIRSRRDDSPNCAPHLPGKMYRAVGTPRGGRRPRSSISIRFPFFAPREGGLPY